MAPVEAVTPISSDQNDTAQTADQPPESPSDDASSTAFSQSSGMLQEGPGKGSKSPYGSAKRRMRRNTSQRLDAVVSAPPHYVQNNIKLYQPTVEGDSTHKEINGGNASDRPDEEMYPNATVGQGAYRINREVLFEVQASVNAGLRPSWAGEADSLAASKPHLVLQSPKDGGSAFLDAVVDNAASRCRADVVRLDALDIADFVGDHNTMNPPPYTSGYLRTLGYDTLVSQSSRSSEQARESEEDGPEAEAWDEDDADVQPGMRPGMGKSKSSSIFGQPMVISSVSGNINDLFKNLGFKSAPQGGKSDDQAQTIDSPTMLSGTPPLDQSVVVKFIESLLNETELQRQARGDNVESDSASKEEPKPANDTAGGAPVFEDAPETTSRGIVLHIKDYLEIYSISAGNSLLRAIHEMVLRRRKSGHRVFLLGTTSSEDLLPTFTKDGWKDVQNESTSGPYRTIIVPCTSPDVEDIFRSDESTRVRDVNIRHLQDMIKRLTFDPASTDAICRPNNLQLQTASVFGSDLADEVWSFERVQRLTNTALGLLRRGEEMTADHIEWALNMISSSDNAKSDWLAADKKRNFAAPSGPSPDSQEALDDRMKKLRKQCNSHERKLLNGMVDPSNISTTFNDVRAAGSTVDALQNLTSLALTRPEAFTYGILAAEKIPGLLLYGPPGTGKTLLAKAVAKESGATVLEVSGSDVYDMYVGEGEKNVRAIFSLAKKIAPCVVFIDEADAIFGQRSNSGTRTTHREIINQFLREWDGMNEKSAFIMVATNRPFDLDDAVLRRLPRRLLVDLPTEQDREAILNIHLKGEQLAEDVSVAKLAQKTPFYSGSDLKNVCVAAALTCVREETDAALKHAKAATSNSAPSIEAETATVTGAEASASSESKSPFTENANERKAPEEKQTYKYPEKRILTSNHFEKALAEISASISDDMSSLTAIRKFDEKYGDRRGRRKKAKGPGFGTISDEEREKLDDGRVRTEQ